MKGVGSTRLEGERSRLREGGGGGLNGGYRKTEGGGVDYTGTRPKTELKPDPIGGSN